ncbi:MAG: hypothetical protein QHH19_06120 [Candidatus Thermoplasmatota archaeon]|nr:hypothetical protein [Candidatus Thermoplasmatota archaeon]
MTEYCSICGEELDPEEEPFGICESCRLSEKNSHVGDIEDVEPDMR